MDTLHLAYSKNLREPDETAELPGITEHQVELGDLTVARVTLEPGWRWSTHIRPHVGGDWCQARHVGVVLSGRLGIRLKDGTTFELGPDDVYEIPPGHDGYVIGHEPCEAIEWAGTRAFWGFRAGAHGRALATLLFTDVVDSTAVANRLGDGAWRALLSGHFEAARSQLERYRGTEVKTTGDGLLATFDGPAQALHGATAIRRAANREDLHVRAAVHVGEVEIVGTDLRGMAVHEAARIMAKAAEDEILVSETTRTLALAAGLAFEDRGSHTLKGLPGEWRLFAFAADAQSA
jgi:class 3 adenylate cyclase/mannose-6-phosphate isomerase-like protein (cupin superfamily)